MSRWRSWRTSNDLEARRGVGRESHDGEAVEAEAARAGDIGGCDFPLNQRPSALSRPLHRKEGKEMTNANYNRGRNLEYLIKDKLEKEGYFVTRSAGSHGVDLVAMHQSS